MSSIEYPCLGGATGKIQRSFQFSQDPGTPSVYKVWLMCSNTAGQYRANFESDPYNNQDSHQVFGFLIPMKYTCDFLGVSGCRTGCYTNFCVLDTKGKVLVGNPGVLGTIINSMAYRKMVTDFPDLPSTVGEFDTSDIYISGLVPEHTDTPVSYTFANAQIKHTGVTRSEIQQTYRDNVVASRTYTPSAARWWDDNLTAFKADPINFVYSFDWTQPARYIEKLSMKVFDPVGLLVFTFISCYGWVTGKWSAIASSTSTSTPVPATCERRRMYRIRKATY